MGISTGVQIGRYEIRNPLGAGGMGEVYAASDTKLGRPVALKILRGEIASDPQRIHRFVQEAKAASALNHPNIITIYEIEQAESGHYIATELIDGVTLRERIKLGPVSVPEALNITIQLASAISAAHEAGIIHRDIKPENIMLRPDGLVKILDFGIAKLADTESEVDVDSNAETKALVHTEPGLLMGTVRYMSPEQTRGKAIDHRSDIWSLAVVLYELLAGQVPFYADTNADVIAMIIKSAAPPITKARPDAPNALQEIIFKALEKNPVDRYQSAKSLLLDLRRLQKRLEFEDNFKQLDSSNSDIGGTELASFEDLLLTRGDEVSRNNRASLPPNNLVTPRSPIIGRAREIAELCDQLRSGTRLLTLTGVGGTGKTTLAQVVANRMLPEFPDGVFFIKLGNIRQPELVPSAIAQPLGVKPSDGRTINEALISFLQRRRLLLVVDNFEQVITARPFIAELLESAPDLQIVLTSREVLHLSFEQEYMVPPLALPESLDHVSASESSNYEAVLLFVERARAVQPKFALTDDNVSSVLKICMRLEGLPLAIELAAARVKILSPQAILARLDSRLKFLTGGAHDLPARQRTMRGAVEWSYELLTEDEKCLFSQLAVFEGGFYIAAASYVIAGPPPEETDELNADVLEGISSLVDKSLLVTREQADGEVRFRMLDVVREYALEHFETRSDAEELRRNQAAYYLAVAEEAEPHLHGWHPAKWLDKLEEEHDNLRAALRWALGHDVETAARLAAAIRYLWNFQGYMTEGLNWSESILKLGDDVPRGARWKILSMAGNLARFQGNHQTARRMYEEGLAEGRAANDLSQISLSCRGLAGLSIEQGTHQAAREYIEEALSSARQVNDEFGIARSLNMRGDLARAQGQDAVARPFYEEALTICRKLGNQYAVGNILNNLAAAEYIEGDYATAGEHFAEGLDMAQGSGGKMAGDKIAISYALDGFGGIAAARGEMALATQFAGAAEKLRESINYHIEPAERRFRETYLRSIRSVLPEDLFSIEYSKGRSLKLDQAIALAIDLRDSDIPLST